jgi:hypothetical protein
VRRAREPIEVDYRIRPAKQAERSLLCDVVARLDRLRPITNFRYIGMGSIYFVDFVLIHRLFGIDAMTSIEQREEILERCRFNRPYECIDIIEKSVASALPELRSEQPTVMWLDYTGRTDAGRLEEIAVAVVDLATPSLFAITTDVSVAKEDERVTEFRRHFGGRDAARITKPADLNRKKFAPLMWSYIDGAIRNAVADRIDGARYEQILHVRYADGADMLTVGGLIYSDEEDLRRCDFDSLDFPRHGAEPYELRVPRLTYRERAALDQLLPDGNLDDAPAGLEREDIDDYADLYRHAPFYVDVHV